MRHLTLTRDEAEALVDLLEDCNPETQGTWRFNIADELRELFGMCSRERSMKIKAEAEKLELSK